MKPIHRNLLAGLAAAAFTTITFGQSPAENPTTPPPPHEKQAPAVEKNLKVFDTLDFDVFSNQKWDRLHESHAKDIVVTWPDGHESKGIDKHIEDDMAMLRFTDADYGWVTQQVKAIADCHAKGRIVSALEGGYALSALGRSAVQHIRALAGLNA